jgi:hypothetical protein
MFTGSKTHLLRTGLSADQYISSPEAADRYHQHPLHETSPSTQASSASLLNRCDFKVSLPLLISREVLLLWSVGLIVCSKLLLYRRHRVPGQCTRNHRGDEAGACASVAAMIHLPADVPFVLHRPVHQLPACRCLETAHELGTTPRWWRRISNQSRELQSTASGKSTLHGCRSAHPTSHPSTQDEASSDPLWALCWPQGALPCHTGDSGAPQ